MFVENLYRDLSVSAKVRHVGEPNRFLLSELKHFVDAAIRSADGKDVYIDLVEPKDGNSLPVLSVKLIVNENQ